MNLIEYYTSLLIIQYYNKPKARKEIEILAKKIKELNDFCKNLLQSFDIDTAEGKQLDILGKIIGFNREVNKFDEIGNIIGKQTLNDKDYRFFLKIVSSSNYCNNCMSSDLENSINDVVNYAFNGKAQVRDNKNMSLTLYVNNVNDIDPVILMYRLDILPRPQGVKYTGVILQNDNTFNFREHKGGKGFGDPNDPSVGGVFVSEIS